MGDRIRGLGSQVGVRSLMFHDSVFRVDVWGLGVRVLELRV
jgi:hypothetical protein